MPIGMRTCYSTTTPPTHTHTHRVQGWIHEYFLCRQGAAGLAYVALFSAMLLQLGTVAVQYQQQQPLCWPTQP